MPNEDEKNSEPPFVLMMPDYSENNPYQELLVNHVEDQGNNVVLSWGIGTFPLLGAIKEHGKPDIFHLHWTHPFWMEEGTVKSFLNGLRLIFELLWIRLTGIRLIWTIHNKLEHERTHPGIDRFVRKWICRLSHQLIVHCNKAKEDLKELYSLSEKATGKFNVIPHGNYCGVYKNNISRQKARTRLQIDADAFVYLFTGSIRPYKGVNLLLKAFDSLSDPDSILLIAGNPQNETIRENLENEIGDNRRIRTTFRFVDPSEHQLFFNAADVCVFPFRDILTSGSVILAMTFEKPLIVPGLGCMPDMVPDNGGIVYDSEKTNALTRALSAIQTRDLGSMGRANRRKVESWSWKEIGRLTAEIYERE